ncbi:sugar phosphate nucleotidyltransferase [Bacillus sp. FJAT-26390]|uniref:sugar phosphate nucleotidyltransferase n=1 Tax=Bacillus sp. FJAT-26390 TaxID=1743142 RepID=UPI0008080CAB|nr:sugar phosphate nucleotidyltransferase [Bacillus sp. FJAT-26390]OBZ13459.1 mannose-1-phosphate guanylyltransferase [Bacillus sp. FJAT-26390]
MKIILLSGGSGKRLWPLSNSKRAKQYLPVLEGPRGGMESMLQRLWRQLDEADLQEHTRIATCREQVEILQRQVGLEAPLIIEPEQRDTFPAVALAAAYLYSIAGVSLSETIIIMPVDAYVDNDFFSCIRGLPKLSRESRAELLMVGTRPSFPSEQYGYIVPETSPYQEDEGMCERKVRRFKEKPYEAEAESLIADGAFWNSGIYAFQLDFMIAMLMNRGLPIHYDELYKQYSKIPRGSFEVEVTQKTDAKSVIGYDGEWKDLGTWKTLSEELSFDRLGLGEVSADSEQSQLINELDIPISIIGLSNVFVAASPDGILVTSKDADSVLNAKLRSMNERPKFEEHRWGHSRVIDSAVMASGLHSVTKRVFISAGQNLSYQMHFKRKEVWTIIAGEGLIVIDELFRHIAPGDTIVIPERSRHSLRAITDVELIEVQTGQQINEDDVIRLGVTWDEITSQLNMA